MKNYRKIIEAFLAGEVEGIDETGRQPEHIETQISHIFLFSKTVYKICKRNNLFVNENFRNLADRQVRIDFYKADFFENNYFSPDVYLRLYGIGMVEEKVAVSDDIDGAEDVVMKMRRIDSQYNLTNLLHAGTLDEQDFQFMGYQQTKQIASYPHQPKTTESYYSIFQRRMDDLRDWMHSVPDYFPVAKTDEIMDMMRNYVEKEKDSFLNFDVNNYVISLDNHSDNIFYENGKIFFLDIYPTKEDWIIVVPWINIYRPATDILILMGECYARAFLRGYEDYYGSLQQRHELFYFIYSAAIQAVSLHNLSKKNEMKQQDALLYKEFILNNIGKL
jgi:aminoglycoside phosphotransferase family enzyme